MLRFVLAFGRGTDLKVLQLSAAKKYLLSQVLCILYDFRYTQYYFQCSKSTKVEVLLGHWYILYVPL